VVHEPLAATTSNRWGRDKQVRLSAARPEPTVGRAMSTTQKIFGVARPARDVTWEDMVPVMQVEAAHVWSLYERDVLRDAWVRTDALGTVYLLEAAPAQAERLLAAQPMARQGLVRFELIPVGPFTPLALLFGTQPHPIPAAPCAHPGATGSRRVLAIDRAGARFNAEELVSLVAGGAARAWSLWKAGIIREHYLRTDRPGVALVLEVPGVASAQAVLSDLPLVRSGVIEFECLSLGAFMGFDALIEGSLDDAPQPLADPTMAFDSAPVPVPDPTMAAGSRCCSPLPPQRPGEIR
jgi:hypothetical protein